MNTIKKPEEINRPRRRFFGTPALMIAAAQLALNGYAQAPGFNKLSWGG